MPENIEIDYIARLRNFLMVESSLSLYEDPVAYHDDYDPSILQGFLVWNHKAYLAKEYEFDDEVRVDYFIIPVFGEQPDEQAYEGTHFVGISIDMHRHADQTGQRTRLISREIRDWHRKLIEDEVLPVTLPTGETYVVIGNGASSNVPLSSQPYNRKTIRFKFPYLINCTPDDGI